MLMRRERSETVGIGGILSLKRAGVGGETPVAIVVARSGCAPDRQALIDWTNERVGKQQRIADVVWRSSLPRNANGKIMKGELKKIFGSAGQA